MKLVILLILCILCIPLPTANADDTFEQLTTTVDNTLDGIDFSQFEFATQNYIDDVYEKIHQIITGEFDSVESIWQVFLQLFFSSLSNISSTIISIGIILIVLGLIKNSSDGFIGKSTQSVISFVGISLIVSCSFSLLMEVYNKVYSLMEQLSTLSQVSFPILLTLLVANGGNAVSSVCQPSMVIFSSYIIELIINVILPLSVASLIFIVVGSISQNVKLDKTSSTINNVSTWLLGIVFMFFSAFTSVQGISASTIDSVSFRAAKFAAKNYIPILGGYLAEGFDMVVASTTLVKNSFGLVCIIAVFFMVVEPLVIILALNLSVQVLTSVCEPLADERYIRLLSKLSKSLSFLAVLVIAVSFMFCILLYICISCCNMV